MATLNNPTPLVPDCLTDEQLLKSLQPEELQRFTLWFNELNFQNTDERAFYANQPLEKATGIECWYSFFTSDLTPAEAIQEDIACGD